MLNQKGCFRLPKSQALDRRSIAIFFEEVYGYGSFFDS